MSYLPLIEVLREELELVDSDPPQAAWKKLLGGVEALMAGLDEPESAERNAAALAVPLGIEPPLAVLGDGDDPERMWTPCSRPPGP